MFIRPKEKAVATPGHQANITQRKGASLPAVPFLRSTAITGSGAATNIHQQVGDPVAQLMYNSAAARAQLWRLRNALPAEARRFGPGDLPNDFQNKAWIGNAVPQNYMEAFMQNGTLDATVSDAIAKEAFLGAAGRGERPVKVELHDRIYDEHVAKTNSAAEVESLRRYNEAPGSKGLNYPRIFSWVIGDGATIKKAAKDNIVAKTVIANTYKGAPQLGVDMSLSTRQISLERTEFKTRAKAIQAGAESILAVEGSKTRVTGVLSEKAGGRGVSSFTGPWTVADNTWQLYHYAAGGAGGADAIAAANKKIKYQSGVHGTPATIVETAMPHAGIAAAAFE
jgi:hypothetical protein